MASLHENFLINNDAVAVPPNADASYSTECSFWKIITNLGKIVNKKISLIFIIEQK